MQVSVRKLPNGAQLNTKDTGPAKKQRWVSPNLVRLAPGTAKYDCARGAMGLPPSRHQD